MSSGWSSSINLQALLRAPRLWVIALAVLAVGAGSGLTTAATPPKRPDPDRILTGTMKAETLSGGSGSDVIVAMAGNDRLYGRLGDDFLEGGEGNDKVYPGGGRDVVSAGPGDDTVYAATSDAALDRIHCGAGMDTAYVSYEVLADGREIRDKTVQCERVYPTQLVEG